MSAHKFRLEFSVPARMDVLDIMAYTLEHGGERQLDKYKGAMDKAFTALAADPLKNREKAGWRMLRVERHRIFYRIEGATIYILRILHERMDTQRHVGPTQS